MARSPLPVHPPAQLLGKALSATMINIKDYTG